MTASKAKFLKNFPVLNCDRYLKLGKAQEYHSNPKIRVLQVLRLDRLPALAPGQRLRRHRPHRLQVQDGRASLPRLQPRHGRLLHGVRTSIGLGLRIERKIFSVF